MRTTLVQRVVVRIRGPVVRSQRLVVRIRGSVVRTVAPGVRIRGWGSGSENRSAW